MRARLIDREREGLGKDAPTSSQANGTKDASGFASGDGANPLPDKRFSRLLSRSGGERRFIDSLYIMIFVSSYTSRQYDIRSSLSSKGGHPSLHRVEVEPVQS